MNEHKNKKPTRVFDEVQALRSYDETEDPHDISDEGVAFLEGARWMFEKDREEILRLESMVEHLKQKLIEAECSSLPIEIVKRDWTPK